MSIKGKLDSTGLDGLIQTITLPNHYKIIVESNSLLFYNHLKQDNDNTC